MTLNDVLREQGRFLVVRGDGTPELASKETVADVLCDAPLRPLVVLDIERGLPLFLSLVGEQERFTVDEVAKLAGTTWPQINHWTNAGLIQPLPARGKRRERSYSIESAFVAGIIGSLRRVNMPPDVVYSVASFLNRVVSNSEATHEK